VVVGHQMRFDSSEGFPLVTTKKLHLEIERDECSEVSRRAIPTSEISTDPACASGTGADGAAISAGLWPAWSSCPRRTGAAIDQSRIGGDESKGSPDSRRLIVTAWIRRSRQNALPPCHCMFQFYARQWSAILQLYQLLSRHVIGVPVKSSP